MRDSILKGTGNSRFLKSGIPDGTTWAEALAMLRAGTFPIDFNGINTEGFQQVGTPLNKANLLKDVNALTLGLTGDAVPNDMFNVLAHAGDLHVWRKTVVNASEKPAGYTLGVETTKTLGLTRNSDSSYWAITVELASSVSVDYAGNVTLVSPSNLSVYAYNGFANSFSGKFFRLISVGSSVTGTQIDTGDIYFVPSGNKLIIRADASGSKFYLDLGMKLVTGYAKTPAGTTVTYPVSTNRNAYQEGSDAKPAGYTLGEVKTGKHILSYQHSDLNEIHWEYSSRITVSDDGTVSLVSPSSEDIDGGDYTSVAENLIGKFARPTEDHSGFKTNVIVFFPSDATVTRDTTTYGYNAMTISKYQPVTGYAAIPAGTTIEYLGCLGEKDRMQVVSYVGTGTYGADNPCSLTFDFPPKVVMFIDYVYTDGRSRGNHFVNNYSNIYYEMTRMSTEKLTGGYTQNNGFGGYSSQLYGKKTNGGKTITWYAKSGSDYQANESNYVYYYLGIG